MKIRNVLFDMGNVLIRFDRNVFMERLGISAEDQKLLTRELFLSVEWVQMDHGTISDADATRQICSRIPEHLHEAAGKLVAMWDRPILPIEGMAELIQDLKQTGYGIYLLSNASTRQHEYWPRIPGSEYFDGTIISADEKVMKPHPDFFLKALERFSLNPEECVFVDDLPTNIEGAMCCGIPGIVFHGDAKLLRSQLRAFGVQIAE